MLNFCSLYSGSSGNCLFVESENAKLLIDAGVSLKKIEQSLETLKIPSSSLNGILITHEHSDHIKSLGNLSKKFDLPVFVFLQTLDAMPKQKEKIPEKNIKKFKIEEKFEIGDLQIKPFSIPHDAANPCGFNVFNGNKKISTEELKELILDTTKCTTFTTSKGSGTRFLVDTSTSASSR